MYTRQHTSVDDARLTACYALLLNSLAAVGGRGRERGGGEREGERGEGREVEERGCTLKHEASQCASKHWVEEEGQCVEGAAVPSQAARGAGAVEAASSHPASDRLRVARELEPHTSCHGIRVLSPLSLSPAFHFHKHCFPTIASVVKKSYLRVWRSPLGSWCLQCGRLW